MSVRPIDLQTNISQALKVGDSEHARAVAMVQQQHALSQESDEKSRRVNERLDELKKAEGNIIRDKEDRERNARQRHDQEHDQKKEKIRRPGEPVEDDRMGRIIDVLK